MAALPQFADRLRWFAWSALRPLLSFNERLGRALVSSVARLAGLLALCAEIVLLAVRPSTWTPPTRVMLMRQMLFTGVDGLPVTLRVSVAGGILIIVEAAMWLDQLGTTTEIVGPMLLTMTVRNLAPLVACLAVIGRSGMAMATELATMKVFGELNVLESLGIDVMSYLVVPRVISAMMSVFCLAIVVVAAMFCSGYAMGLLMNVIHLTPYEFFVSIFASLEPADLLFFVPKTVIAGFLVGVICCWNGLSGAQGPTDVPRLASRCGVHALTAVFAVNAILSLVIYGRVLIFQVI